MHIRRIEIENIRAIKHLVWELSEDQNGAGWHVILGDNGSGKTSFVRAVALSLSSTRELWSFFENAAIFAGKNKDRNIVQITTYAHHFYDQPIETTKQENSLSLLTPQHSDGSIKWFADAPSAVGSWDEKSKGFLCISFGPHRRFSGMNNISERFKNSPRLIRHLTAFYDDAGLTETIPWLQKLHSQGLEGDVTAAMTLQKVREFINQSGFLAHDAKIIDVSTKGVKIEDGDGNRVPVEEMSDGYRSVLSLTFELIRQLVDCFGVDKVFDPTDSTKIIAPGVVQIDEVDAHLHPTWQHRIVDWFTTHFPNIQFIVTTHSPIICQAADTVFKLPTPGTDEVGEFVTGNALLRLKYGSVSEAYGTGVFGVGVERSEESKELLDELKTLNLKELGSLSPTDSVSLSPMKPDSDEGLTESEIERQEFLRGLFPSSTSIGISRRRPA